MSDPIAFVPYEPNATPTPADPSPVGGDPSRLQAAIAELLPWQSDLLRARMGGKTTESLTRLRAGMAGLSDAVERSAAILGAADFAAVLDEVERNRAHVSRVWGQYHRRRP